MIIWILRSFLLVIFINLAFLSAQWKTTPYEDNIISAASDNQQNSRICSDGNDGAFIVWEDFRDIVANGSDIYLQKINKDGYTVFAENGIPICTTIGDQFSAQVMESNNGSAIIFWLDNRTNFTNSTDLYAQKVDAQGNILWSMNGIPISDYTTATPGAVVNFTIASDSEGGVFITWQLNYFGYGMIRAQRINTDGNILWNPEGLYVTNGPRDDRFPQIIKDNHRGGAVIVYRGTIAYSIMAQRISPNGNILWGSDGITVFLPGPQSPCSIAPGDIYSNGGLVAIAYSFYGPVYAQLLDTLGNKLWGLNGITINNASGQHAFAKIENDFDENQISPFLPGFLDTTFGIDGITTTTIQGFSSIWDAALQSDDKIVTGGFSSQSINSDTEFSLARYNSDGILDNTFGIGGIIHHSVTNGHDWIHSIAIQPDGKIIAAGEGIQDGIHCFALARYNLDGSLDSTFGLQGTIVTIADSAHYNTIHSISLQSDGKIVAASGYFGILVRYNNDGSLDNTFGVNGFVQTQADFLESVVIQDDGKIVAVGSRKQTNSEYDFILVRYNPDGSPDSTFGSNGLVVINTGAELECLFTVKIQDGGKIITGGTKGVPSVEYDAVLIRFNEDGSLDNAFGLNGLVVSPNLEIINSLELQTDGKIVTSGYIDSVSLNYKDFVLARFNADGSLDNSFGINGTTITIFDSSGQLHNDARKVLILSNGKIVSAGSSSYSANVSKNVLIGYTGGSKIIGNYYISWLDARNGTGYEIYAQKLDCNGIPYWQQNGINVSNSISAYADDGSTHQLFDNGNSIISVWQDFRPGASGIYAQSISSSGQLMWGNFGIMVSDLSSRLHTVNSGNSESGSGAILTFFGIGDPSGTGSNIYAKRLSADGTLPVELESFTASVNGSIVTLKWKSKTEVNNYGFDIERALLNSPSAIRNPEFEKIGFVHGNGNSNSPKNYSFIDEHAPFHKVAYRLKQIDNDGSYKYSEVIEVELGAPAKFELLQNYPNPFNPLTNIEFRIASPGFVSLKVYGILGTEIATLVNEEMQSGNYSISYNASSLASGIYIYKLQTNTFSETKKMILMK